MDCTTYAPPLFFLAFQVAFRGLDAICWVGKLRWEEQRDGSAAFSRADMSLHKRGTLSRRGGPRCSGM